MSADKERIMADDKKETLAMALRERIGSHIVSRELCNARINACRDLIDRDPGSRSALEPTIQVWIRIRAYHVKTIDDAWQLLMDLGIPRFTDTPGS